MKSVTLKILNKIATVAVALLLYWVIALLQAPKAARVTLEVAPVAAGPCAVAVAAGACRA